MASLGIDKRPRRLKEEDVMTITVTREPEVPDPFVGKAKRHRLPSALQGPLEQRRDEVALEDQEDDERRREDEQRAG
jgi:hypothetical protein